MIRRISSLFLAHAIFLASIPAQAQVLPQVKNQETFIYASIGDPDTMDPQYAYDTASHLVDFQVYESLIGFNKSSTKEFIPLLATAVPSRSNKLISADGLTYTFPIRAGVKFHDGSPLSCEDAEYSFERFMFMDRSGGPAALFLEPIAGTQGTRDEKGNINIDFKKISSQVRCEGQNLKITLLQPYGPFLSIFPQFGYIISKKWSVANGEWDGTEATWKKYNNPKKESSALFTRMNGTGPFMLEKWDQRTKQVNLVRNENYWRAPAKLKRVIIKKIDEFSTRKLLLEKGDVDAIYTSRQFEPQVTGVPGITVYEAPTLTVTALFMNEDINAPGNPYVGSGKLDGNGIPSDFFKDKDVRLAFTHAFNRDAFLAQVARGKDKPARGPIAEGLTGYNPKQPMREFSMAKAAEHFKKAWSGQVWEKGFKMVFTFNAGNDARQQALQMLAKSVQSINDKFQIDVRPIEWSTYVTDQSNKRLAFYYLGWLADYPDSHNFAGVYMHSKGNYGEKISYNNPKADKLVDQAMRETDNAKREALYFQLNQIAYEDVPYIWIAMPGQPLAHRDWVKGFYTNPVFPDSYYFYPLYKSLEPETKARGAKSKGT